MNLKNYYWYFQSALSKDFCDNLIKFGNQQREELALTGGQTEKIKEGKFNGQSDRTLKELTVKFLDDMFNLGIDSYKEFIQISGMFSLKSPYDICPEIPTKWLWEDYEEAYKKF